MANKSKTSITEWIYLLFWIIIPFISASDLIDEKMIPRQLFTGALVLILLGFGWKAILTKKIELSLPVLSYAGFFIFSIASSFSAINGAESFGIVSRYALILCYLIMTIQMLISGRLSKENLIKGVLIFASLTALYTAQQLLAKASSGKFFENIYTVSAFFGHKNLLSSALMLFLPFSVLGYSRLNGFWKKGSLILMFLMIAEIFVLRTRGVWLSTFVGALATFGVYFTIRKRNIEGLKLPVKLIGIGLGIALTMLVALFSVAEVQSSVADQTNLGTRQKFWANSLEMVKEKPILGVGPGNWRVNFPKHNLNTLDYNVMQGITHIQRPHDDYLWVLSENGLVGLLCYLGVFVFAFIKIRGNLKAAESKEEIVLNLALVFGIVAFMSFSITDFPMERITHNALLFSLIALAHYRPEISKVNLSGPILKLALLGLVLFSLGIGSQRWKGEKGAKLVLEYNSQRNAQKIIPAVEETENDYYTIDNYSNPLRYFSAMGKLVQKDFNGALEDIEIAESFHPYNILVLNLKGRILIALKREQEALDYFTKAIDISPRMESALIDRAEIYMNRKDYKSVLISLTSVLPNTRNPKFETVLVPALSEFLKLDPPYFRKLKNFLKQGNPKTKADFLRLYRQYLKQRKKPKLEGKTEKVG